MTVSSWGAALSSTGLLSVKLFNILLGLGDVL